MSKRAGLLEGEAVMLTSQPSKMKKAFDAIILGSVDQLKILRALRARLHMFCDRLDSPKHRA